jgi:hypothetical protein
MLFWVKKITDCSNMASTGLCSAFGKKATDHGSNLTARKFGWVFDRYDCMAAPCGTTPHFPHECSA